MNYAIILAAGVGKRFDDELPKQFHNIKDKPVLIHAMEPFIHHKQVDKIIITVAENYRERVENLITRFFREEKNKMEIVQGGKTRQQSLINACNYINCKFMVTEKDIIITHDAARPFVEKRIIDENIMGLEKSDGVTTCFPTNNSILEVHEGLVTNVPKRDNMYILQTPQTFRLKEYLQTYNNLTLEEKEEIIEASKVYVLRGKTVSIVQGEPYNVKVTRKCDLEIARAILTINSTK